MKRKIVQLVVSYSTFFGCTLEYRQHALCDDGTLWYRDAQSPKDSSWKLSDDQIPEIVE